MTNPPTVPAATFEDTGTALMRIRAAHPGWEVAWDDARSVWWASVRLSPAATRDIFAHSLPVLEAKLDALASASGDMA